MGKSKSLAHPNGERHIEKATGKKYAPKALRHLHKYLDDCTDEELKSIQLKRDPKE